MQKHFSSTIAINITQGVLDELNKRHGFDAWWDSVEGGDQGNIIFTLERIVDKVIESHTRKPIV